MTAEEELEKIAKLIDFSIDIREEMLKNGSISETVEAELALLLDFKYSIENKEYDYK